MDVAAVGLVFNSSKPVSHAGRSRSASTMPVRLRSKKQVFFMAYEYRECVQGDYE
jgi:hypothetical protein